MEIKRDLYLQKLINKKNNKMIKIITGMRRCGKSYLLDPIFKDHLINEGVKEDHIIKIDLDSIENKKLLDGLVLYNYVMSKVKDKDLYYILLDEIQKVSDFESVLNSFLRKENLDVYVTGSNSKFLSTDIITEFRGRGDEIRVYPLCYAEFSSAYVGKEANTFKDYITYGGMPYILYLNTPEEKSKYLNSLFENTYINDIIERNGIQREDILDLTINLLASSVGSLTNPLKLLNTFVSNGYNDLNRNTINTYINYLIDSFLINKAERYDIKGKKYISTPSKYYFTDIGLRNARLNFRQQEETHLMENIIYNELLVRGYNVDVGLIESYNKNESDITERKQLEVDFICNQGSKRYYIQSAFAIPNKEKMEQEQRSLLKIQDNFKKVIIVKEDINLWRNEEGIVIISLQEFLSNPNSLDL
ncbi:MAG: ATP-binding protein [Bacilli bacterium]